MKIRGGRKKRSISSKSTSKIQGKRRIRGRNKSKLVRLAAYPMVTVVVIFLAAAAVGNRARNFEGLAALPYTDSTLYTPRNEHGT